MIIKPFLLIAVLGSIIVYGTTTSNGNQSSSFDDNTDTIHWRPDYKLRVDDFRAKPDTLSVKAAALSNIEFPCTPYFLTDTSVSYKVYCVFNKDNSWIEHKDGKDVAYILRHEQGHFDIGELYRRILTNRLKVLEKMNFLHESSNINKKMNFIVDQTLTEFDSLSYIYDRETSYNRDSVRQAHWIIKIDSMLNTVK